MEQSLHLEQLLRYPKPARPEQPFIDGFPGFHHLTRDERPNSKMAILESGINAFADVRAPDCWRKPAILLRSSPAKAGTEWTPWRDVLDVDRGTMTYFGDHKATTAGVLGSTKGNKALEQTAPLHLSDSEADRALAPPLLVFVTTPWTNGSGNERPKGVVQFYGAAAIRSMTAITAEDPKAGLIYPNYQLELELLNLQYGEDTIDWQWINARKDPHLDSDQVERYEPACWRQWRSS